MEAIVDPRCWCGHTSDTHQHYRPGRDCGDCGPGRCHRYAGMDQPMPATHSEAAALSDAHFYRNLWALSGFAQGTRPAPAVNIPRQRSRPVVDYLEQRRAQARKGGRHA